MAFLDIFATCCSEEQVHNKLMTTICCDYLDEDTCKSRFRKFLLNCRLYLTTPREKNLSNAHDIWDCLERKGKLGVGDYAILKELTSDVDQVIIEIILAAEKKIYQFQDKRSPKRFKSECLTNTSEPSDTSIVYLKETLLKINNFIVMKNQISPFQKRGKELPVDFLYVPSTIREDTVQMQSLSTDNENGTKNGILNNLNELFYKNGDPVRYIFMHGEAGRGKTMYCKQILKQWCTAKQYGKVRNRLSEDEKTLGEFDFTFLVSLRHVNQSRTLLEDMICYDTFKNNKECHDTIRHVLSSDHYRCLIIVDGLDEWRIAKDKSSELTDPGLPNIETFSACTCFFTLRPSRLDFVGSAMYDCDRIVEILGLESKDLELVMDKVLINHYGLKPESYELTKAKADIQERICNLMVGSILKIPLLATTSTMLWHEKKEVGNSLTSFYLALIQMLIKWGLQQQDFSEFDLEILKTNRKQELHKLRILEMPRFKTLKEFSGVLSLLGEIAYADLMTDGSFLLFDKADLQIKLGDILLFALKVGLLSQYEAPGCFDEENVSVNFFHKSVQEFLASFYIATTNDYRLMFERMSSVRKILDSANIFVFCSGLSCHLASEMSSHIAQTAINDNEMIFARERFRGMEKRSIFALYHLQVRCYQELNSGDHGLYSSRPNAFGFTDICPFYLLGKDVFDVTVDILNHHNNSSVSLYLSNMRNNYITDELLGKFLMNANCLQYLSVHDMNIHQMGHTLCLKSLHLDSVSLSQEALLGLKESLTSTKELRALSLRSLADNNDEGKDASLSLSDIICVLPQCQYLYMLEIDYKTLSMKSMSDQFLLVLPQLFNLRRTKFLSTSASDSSSHYYAVILRPLSKLPHLECVFIDTICLDHSSIESVQHLLDKPSLYFLYFQNFLFKPSSLKLRSFLSKLRKITYNSFLEISTHDWCVIQLALYPFSYCDMQTPTKDIHTNDEISQTPSYFMVISNEKPRKHVLFTRITTKDEEYAWHQMSKKPTIASFNNIIDSLKKIRRNQASFRFV